GVTYDYRLADVSYAEVVEYHGLTTLIVEAFEPLPDRFTLYQNYPNPFNAQTTISYYLPNESYVTVSIYDLTGRKLETLVSASPTAPARLSHSGGSVRRGRVVSGRHKVRWEAGDVSSGIYIYRVSRGSFGETDHNAVAKNLILLK
ncbi:MAG: T9SS type A sorting domain-containing protein, partial [Nitrosopumilus sp.]